MIEEYAVDQIHDRLGPAGPGRVDHVDPHVGPPVVDDAHHHDVVHGEQGVHQFVSPVRRHAEDVAHDHLEGDHDDADDRNIGHHLADEEVRLLDGHHEGSQFIHNSRPFHDFPLYPREAMLKKKRGKETSLPPPDHD